MTIHNRHSIRLQSYDYALNGAYFITICTLDREHSLGEIINHEMKLSKIGEIANEKWFDIPNHYNHVELDEFVVMPNHIHGIIWIVGERFGVPDNVPTARLGVPQIKINEDRIRQGEQIHSRKFGKPQSGSLSMIINHFKGSVKRWCNQNDYKWFRWQRNYYEHIIRNDKDLFNTTNYIKNNPINWREDEYRL